MTKDDPVLQNLERFAREHAVTLVEKGEVGFCRPCVGFLRGTAYIDYQPLDHTTYELVDGFPYDRRLSHPPEAPDAYHKHDCLAVLVQWEGDDDPTAADYDRALVQLDAWIRHIEQFGPLEVVPYRNNATGLQARMSGTTGTAIRFKDGKPWGEGEDLEQYKARAAGG